LGPRYLAPFVFLGLLPLGAWLGGAWTFLAAASTPIFLACLDEVLGEDTAPPDRTGRRVPRWAPGTYVVLQLALTALSAAVAARTPTTFPEALGLALSAGVTTGVFGFLAAHELIHSPDRRERALGLGFLATVFYMHFRIAHVYGHHRRAATFEDPASARLGEGLYSFLLRTLGGQFREAWTFEAQRRRRTGKPVVGTGNRMIVYLSLEAALLLALGVASWRALVFFIAVAAISVCLLEAFNYVAHYGLIRSAGPDGRFERLAPHHSWNSRRRMNNAALFNMGRHSDHHRFMTRSYGRLEEVSGEAQLPSGYAAALLTALIPPLWHRTMAPRAQAIIARQALR
jgi:alkane 1-monooxygenase